MSNNEKDISAQASDRTLSRFLATFPAAAYVAESRWSPALEISRPECPEASAYLQIARSESAEGGDDELLTHAAGCSRCGEVLARIMNSLEGNPSPEEAAAIAELANSGMEWQRRLSRELAGTKARRRPGFALHDLLGMDSRQVGSLHSGRRLAGVAIAAIVLLAAGVFFWKREARTPEHELAMAYTQSRTLELRVPDAGYAQEIPSSHTRGAQGDQESALLLEARARLARELERSPQNSHWLELQARADVLEERYDAAADVLDRLVVEGPANAELLTDAASAYYERGLISGSELDRSTALDYLRRADELAPTDPVVLFNEAIVMEDRGQMMNAVEVWNRYITVERDTQWAAEGKRKLAALEQTLNRLKGHQSRVEQMLATPAAMEALALAPEKLASLDEELSSYQLDKLLDYAYPMANEPAPQNSEQARGSPCAQSCMAARKLLKAIGKSLELQHHDPWLSDFLSADVDSLPSPVANRFAQANAMLAEAISENEVGPPNGGHAPAQKSKEMFRSLRLEAGASARILAAARVGEYRAAAELMLALQREVDFRGCRTLGQQLDSDPIAKRDFDRYAWLKVLKLTTEAVCDDTPETRIEVQRHLAVAGAVAAASHYRLLDARIQVRLAGDAENAGDLETAERITLASYRRLVSEDTPLPRIVYALYQLIYAEHDTPRTRVLDLILREVAAWDELIGFRSDLAETHLELARAEIRIGATKEAENQILLAKAVADSVVSGKAGRFDFAEPDIFLADALLERGDFSRASQFLDQASPFMAGYSDGWGLRAYAEARGQLELAEGHLEIAARALESQIRNSEGRRSEAGGRLAASEYGKLDHDLYAELVATWLAQGRSPESVLALWERFRLRSRGLPIRDCQREALDCELPRLRAARLDLGKNLLMGQIVLLDRVLVYRVDAAGVAWTEKPLRRQSLLDDEEGLERAVSSRLTSMETATEMGKRLGGELLPELPAGLDSDSTLLLEPDPLLENLSWPVLPTSSGTLGLQYPVAEVRSILAPERRPDQAHVGSLTTNGNGALIVGASIAAGGEPPLPEALTEARSVDRFLNSPELLLGDHATTVKVGEKLGSATIFHFAGHALQTGNGTELLLAAASPGEASPWVDGAFLRRHPPRACRLAILSACATGTRNASWSHPLQDMVETLGELGVPEVVATRWQIDSEASVAFMDNFYRSLAQGRSVAMALTSARRVQFRKSHNNNPYYWGAFYVTGRETTELKGELHASVEEVR